MDKKDTVYKNKHQNDLIPQRCPIESGVLLDLEMVVP
jgi:hypothetical protein